MLSVQPCKTQGNHYSTNFGSFHKYNGRRRIAPHNLAKDLPKKKESVSNFPTTSPWVDPPRGVGVVPFEKFVEIVISRPSGLWPSFARFAPSDRRETCRPP